MSDYPLLSTRLIGQTESALGALLAPLLAEAEMTFLQWVVLSLTGAGGTPGAGIARGQLIDRIADARKVDAADVSAAITELEDAAALVTTAGQVTLTDLGRASHGRVLARVEELTDYVFDLPAEDLAAAGRVMATVSARANAVLANNALANAAFAGTGPADKKVPPRG
jgi:DNA-binding MarR family transcriptional regulator